MDAEADAAELPASGAIARWGKGESDHFLEAVKAALGRDRSRGEPLPRNVRSLLERVVRAAVHAQPDGAAMGAAAAADFLKKASLAAGPPPGDGVAPAGDELAITAAADADAFGSFVADLLWVLDAELGDWDKPPKDLARDPARALEQVKKDLPPPRLRLVELVKQIVKNECVSATLLRLRLETELLFFAGLLPTDMGNFARKTIRNNTAQLYKQQKFNLLREESEGWARVIVEVGGNCVNADDLASTYDATPAELEAIMRNRVSTVLRNLRALVGYFDLDPNRVLDVIIDIFIANVRDYYDFFLRLLEESPWGRKTSWKGDASAPVAPVPTDTPMRDEDASDDEGEAGQDDEGPQPIPLLAQILGFQYQYYAARLASSSAPAGWPFTDDLPPRDRHPGEVPTDLQLVAALLIRRGLVRIEDLWVHMGRGIGTGSEDADAADLEAHFKEWQDAQRKKARENRGASALAEAAPLADESAPRYPPPPATAAEEGKKPEPPPPKASLPSRPAPRLIDQKANLCCALLAVGAYHQALWILDRLPKLPYVQPEISALLCRAIHVMIEPLYAPLRPLPKVVFTPSSLQISPTIHWRDVDVPRTARRGQRVYRYFYSEWTEGLPSWDRPQALLHGLSGVLRYVTVQGLGSDPRLWAKLVRIAAAHIRTSILPRGPVGSEELLPELRPWLVIVSRYLLPALSTTYANPGLANEMWNLLSQLTWPIRQTLYRDWAKRFDEVPELEYHKEKCTRDTQYFMKRISQETVRQLGRVLGKVVHGNPVIAYPIVLATIEEYSNFIAPIVESSKYVTHFGIDVLSDSLLAKLEGDRDRLKADGVSVEKWFMNIAMFASAALKKHSDRMELSGFLKLVYDRLTEKESVADLTILAEIISKMAGIESIESLSDAQLEALSGGDTLRREGVYGAEINRNTRKSSVKLRDTLVENRLATAMALAIGRERAVVAHSDIAEHLKMISSMYDQCQDSLVQYAEFLAGSLDAAAYGEVMPMPDELVLDYHLEPDVAFHLARPKLNHAIRAADAAKKAQAALANATKPAVAAPEKEKPAEKKEASVENGTDKAGSAMDVDEPAVKVETAPVEQKEADVWHPGLLEIIRRVERILPQPTWKGISPNFYVTFWQLSLYDIHVPKARYQSQIDTERQKMKELDPTDQKSFKSDKAGQEKRRMYERSATLVKTLEQELREQQENHKKVLARLQREKDHWFAADGQRHSATNLLSQHCLVPRGFFSHTDAVYCAKFVFLIHKMGAANFSTIALLDRSLSDITIFVIGATENEARHYGRWLSEVLHTLHRWYLSRKLFEEEGRGPGEGLPGLVMVSGRRGPDDKTPAPLDYAGFQRIHGKWFDRIQLALTHCLSSGEYMRMRNAIIVLDAIIPFFPNKVSMRRKLVEIVEEAMKHEEGRKESRRDILQLLRNCLGKLQQKKDLVDDEPSHDRGGAVPAGGDSKTGDRGSSSLRPSVDSGKGRPSSDRAPSPRPLPPRTASPAVHDGRGQSLNPEAVPFVPSGQDRPSSTKPDAAQPPPPPPPPATKPAESGARDKPPADGRRPGPPAPSLPSRPSVTVSSSDRGASSSSRRDGPASTSGPSREARPPPPPPPPDAPRDRERDNADARDSSRSRPAPAERSDRERERERDRDREERDRRRARDPREKDRLEREGVRDGRDRGGQPRDGRDGSRAEGAAHDKPPPPPPPPPPPAERRGSPGSRDGPRDGVRPAERDSGRRTEREREPVRGDREGGRPGEREAARPSDREASRPSDRDGGRPSDRDSVRAQDRDREPGRAIEKEPAREAPRPPEPGGQAGDSRPPPPPGGSPLSPSGITIAGRAKRPEGSGPAMDQAVGKPKSILDRLGSRVGTTAPADRPDDKSRSTSRDRDESSSNRDRDPRRGREDEKDRERTPTRRRDEPSRKDLPSSAREDSLSRKEKEPARDDREKDKEKDRDKDKDRGRRRRSTSRSRSSKDKPGRGRSRSRSADRHRDRDRHKSGREGQDSDRERAEKAAEKKDPASSRKRTDRETSPDGSKDDRRREEAKRIKEDEPSPGGSGDGAGAGRKRRAAEISTGADAAPPPAPEVDSPVDSGGDPATKRRKLDRNPSYGRALNVAMTEASQQSPSSGKGESKNAAPPPPPPPPERTADRRTPPSEQPRRPAAPGDRPPPPLQPQGGDPGSLRGSPRDDGPPRSTRESRRKR